MGNYKLKSGKRIQIGLEECPQNPREWDTRTTIVVLNSQDFSRKLGDDCTFYDEDDNEIEFVTWEEAMAHIQYELDAAVILPLYVGDDYCRLEPPIDMKYNKPNGFVVVSNQVLKNALATTVSPQELALSWCKWEVEIYNAYLQGDVKCWELFAPKKRNGWELIDSCSNIFQMGDEEIIEGLGEEIESETDEVLDQW